MMGAAHWEDLPAISTGKSQQSERRAGAPGALRLPLRVRRGGAEKKGRSKTTAIMKRVVRARDPAAF